MTNSSQRRGYAVSLQILDWIKEGIFIVDASGDIIHCNRSAEQILGLLAKQIKCRSIFNIVETYDATTWPSLWKELSKCHLLEGKTQVKTPAGASIQVYDQLHLIELGGSTYAAYYFKPLTKGEFFNTLHTKISEYYRDVILCFDSAGKLLYYNPAALNTLGYEPSQMSTLRAEAFCEDHPSLEGYFECLKTVHSIKKSDGSSIKVEAQLQKINYYDQVLTLVFYRPIMDRDSAHLRIDLAQAQEKIEKLEAQLINEKAYLEEAITQQYNFNDIITCSKAYQQVLHQVVEVADTHATVLILGETGTGKELLARTIHKLSRQADQMMVKVNCAALPADLIESELFGYEKGAFTGAYQKKIGRFELAHNGTLFLDEIGELPLVLQSKILRVLQEGEFEPLGSNKTRKVKVRIIAATNRDLRDLVRKGAFRADLFYRINVFPIENIPLRKRKGDIPLLVDFFIKKNCKKTGIPLLRITRKTLANLEAYSFPGNIRELENIIERACILSKNGVLNERVVLDSLQHSQSLQLPTFQSLEALQKQHIIEALEKTNWKVTGTNSAAGLLQINGKTLASKMRKLNIKRP